MTVDLLTWGMIGAAALVLLALVGAMCRALMRNPRGDVETGLAWWFVRAWCRVVHRVSFAGLEHVPRWTPGDAPVGPIVIVANHSAGIDPLLIQSALGFEVRWMMMRAMMVPWAAPLWEWCGVIGVGPGDSRAAREAIRVLKDAGAVGIFPEGAIERPARMLMPFEPGVGLIVYKTGAQVLMAVIDGTPERASAFMSLITPSRARVRFLPMVSYQESGLGAAAIAADLERRMREATGWPVHSPGSAEEPR